MAKLNKLTARYAATLEGEMFRLVDPASLAVFRLIFGLCCLHLLTTYFNSAMIDLLEQPGFRFSFYGFEWIRPWPGKWLYHHVWMLRALAFFIAIGFLYRLCIMAFFIGFTYLFLIDQGIYQNHFYLIALLAFLLIFMPAHAVWSVDSCIFKSPKAIPKWPIWALRAQLALVYFFAGLAKINADWLRGEPMRAFAESTPFSGFLGQEWVIYTFCYVGLFFDLAVGPLLAWRRTRLIAYDMSLLFHAINAQLWNIDVFPYFMIGASLIFFDPDWPSALLKRVWRKMPSEPVLLPKATGPVLRRCVLAFLSAYFLLQSMLPLRHLVYPGNALWTDEGRMFAWRMMLVRKRSVASFYARDPIKGHEWEIHPKDLEVASNTTMNAWAYPDKVLQFAHHAAAVLRQQGHENVEIRARVYTSLHRRKPQLHLDPNLDLTRVKRTILPARWILPLKESLPCSSAERESARDAWVAVGGDRRAW